MSLKKMFLAIAVCSLLAGHSNAQTLKDIAVVEKQTQDCLDKGENMLGCNADYADKMDSMLNLVYNKLRKKLPAAARDTLKAQELAWIKKRNAYVRRQSKEEVKKLGNGQDAIMVNYHDYGDFTKKRLIVLIKRFDALNK